ncbi:hypothetical protein PG994_012760 [Apiospora phragmitis]|uniref:Laminin EGF-like domain-containing protein n=1 Tax=Apiospora phragmitis TaxID=2905665 RepID=A0ABR1TBC5_9PEZI
MRPRPASRSRSRPHSPFPTAPSCRTDGREDDQLARRFNREVRHSGYPTRYIVNDGSLVINESLLHDSNTLIYNRRGSHMSVRPDRCCCDGTPSCRCGCRGRGCCRGSRDRGGGGHYRPGGGYNCCYCTTTRVSISSSRYTEICRICECRRAWHGGYCRECVERRCVPPWYLRGPREPFPQSM